MVVLTWNGRQHTLNCLSSLARVKWERLTIIVVDNGSTDETVECVRKAHPDARLIPTGANLGFAEGNNVGVREALSLDADYVFVLNNDTTVAENAVSELVSAASELSDAAAVCPMIYFAEPADVIWYAGATFDPARSDSGRMTGYREVDNGQYRGVRRVDRAVGAAMLIPRRALETTGLFDKELFLYYEDVEWSLRAQAHGLSVYLAPTAKVWHSVSAAAGGEESLVSAYYGTRNHLCVLERYEPLRRRASLWRRTGVLLVHAAAARRSRAPFSYLRAVASGGRDAASGRLGRCPQSEPRGSS